MAERVVLAYSGGLDTSVGIGWLKDATGKEVSVAKGDIAERRESELSLMPSNFNEALTEAEFYDLMAFLLSHGSK